MFLLGFLQKFELGMISEVFEYRFTAVFSICFPIFKLHLPLVLRFHNCVFFGTLSDVSRFELYELTNASFVVDLHCQIRL